LIEQLQNLKKERDLAEQLFEEKEKNAKEIEKKLKMKKFFYK